MRWINLGYPASIALDAQNVCHGFIFQTKNLNWTAGYFNAGGSIVGARLDGLYLYKEDAKKAVEFSIAGLSKETT